MSGGWSFCRSFGRTIASSMTSSVSTSKDFLKINCLAYKHVIGLCDRWTSLLFKHYICRTPQDAQDVDVDEHQQTPPLHQRNARRAHVLCQSFPCTGLLASSAFTLFIVVFQILTFENFAIDKHLHCSLMINKSFLSDNLCISFLKSNSFKFLNLFCTLGIVKINCYYCSD